MSAMSMILLTATASFAAQNSAAATNSIAGDPAPAFDVATIKRSDPNSTYNSGFHLNGRHISCTKETLASIFSVAYGIHVKQIVNAPDWLSKDRYDIDGISDTQSEPTLPQMQGMYRKLLADRFHLIFHPETRQLPIYALIVTKGGPRLAPLKPGESTNEDSWTNGAVRTMELTATPMPVFAIDLDFFLERPVIDQTHLQGSYDFMLKWTSDDSKLADPDQPPSLFTAIQEQLGLKLEAVKGPAEVYVIDHAERPSDN
jgi:uncharacterized protein (TIGR03435 family)